MFSKNTIEKRTAFRFFFSLLAGFCFLIPSAKAQVAVSVGAQEIYDDNIFLEADNPFPKVVTNDPNQPGGVVVIRDDNDGNTDDDFITNVHVGVSGNLPENKYAKIGLEAKVGTFIFANETDQNRMTLDTTLDIQSAESFIPHPFFVGVSSVIGSGASDVSVAEGTATRLTETHVAKISTGIHQWEFAKSNDLSLAYDFARHDFLGDFTFKEADTAFDDKGSDFFSNGVNGELAHHFSDKLETDLSGGTNYINFTSVESSDNADKSNNDNLNRYDSNLDLGFKYQASEALQLAAQVGYDFTTFADDPEPVTIRFADETGQIFTVVKEQERSQGNLAYSGSLGYTPDKNSTLALSISQGSGTDTDGDRITLRSLVLNATHSFTERFGVKGSGRFSQFENGDSLNDATERFEVTAALRFSLTQAISLDIGWNYVDQNASENPQELLLQSTDYKSNRAFIAINGGLVGVKS